MKFFTVIFLIFNFLTKYNAQSTSKYTLTDPKKIYSNMVVNTVGLISWYPHFALKPININCPWNNTESCTSSFNPFTFTQCSVLKYFNTNVCGGLSCYFNETTKKCTGQCSNPLLQTCISRTEIPTSDFDCYCGSSSTNPVIFKNGIYMQTIPSCDSSNCTVNSCSFFYVSVNRVGDNTLYASCNNDMPVVY